MSIKRLLFTLTVFLIFISVIGVYASNDQTSIDEIYSILNNTNSSELTGCCSVVCQLDGNNSLFSFRRDANNSADIHIEKIDWHGKPAIKQYKTDGGYFCQVIITNDGWVIGYGGIDDGADNQRIENITANMVVNKSKIDNNDLKSIERIKAHYEIGHVIVKAPNGTYGVAMATTHFTGQLKEGDYISVPNRYSYVRTGDIKLNAPDKIKTMTKLATSDMFGLSRRDITTFNFHNVSNDTFNGNMTDIYISNDDGSMFDMNTGNLRDDVYLNETLFKKEDIPISPKYAELGHIGFEEEGWDILGIIFTILWYFVVIVLLLIIFVLSVRLFNKIRYARRNQKRLRETKDLWGTRKR